MFPSIALASNLPNDLQVRRLVEVAPGFPIVFTEWILNANDWILADKLLVQVRKLLVGKPFALVAIRILEIKIVFAGILFVKLASRDVHGNIDFSGISSFLDSLDNEIQSLFCTLDIWRNTSLVTNISS